MYFSVTCSVHSDHYVCVDETNDRTPNDAKKNVVLILPILIKPCGRSISYLSERVSRRVASTKHISVPFFLLFSFRVFVKCF